MESVLAYEGELVYEVIIVDDGSTDAHTIAVLDELAKEGVQVVHQSNQGLGRARNEGIRRARGKYILPLDSDNKIEPAYLTEGVYILDSQPETAVVYSDRQLFGIVQEVLKVGEFNLLKMIIANYIDACAIYRREVWEDIGGYDECMPVMGVEDWDFWMRSAMRGWQFAYIPKPLFHYYVQEESMITNANRKHKQLVEYIFNKKEYVLAKAYRQVYEERNRLAAATQDWEKHYQELLSHHQNLQTAYNQLKDSLDT